MDLEKIKANWTEIETPVYSKEELASIYSIKQSNILLLFKSTLKADLIISELLVLCFILFLQLMDFKTSNFWSVIMGFVGIQHLFIYLLQSILIKRMVRFTDNVSQSINTSIGNLKLVMKFYRVFPVLLSLGLYTLYVSLFDISLASMNIFIIGIGLVILVLAVSEFLSLVLVKTHIKRLEKLKTDFDTNN